MPRNDFTKAERDAWQAQRLAGERGRGQHSAGINKLPRAPNPFGPHGSLSKQINNSLQRQVNEAIANKAPKGATLHSTAPSTCLENLTWKDGIATATFYRGGAVVYDFSMTESEWLDWASAPSIGKFGNEEVFD